MKAYLCSTCYVITDSQGSVLREACRTDRECQRSKAHRFVPLATANRRQRSTLTRSGLDVTQSLRDGKLVEYNTLEEIRDLCQREGVQR